MHLKWTPTVVYVSNNELTPQQWPDVAFLIEIQKLRYTKIGKCVTIVVGRQISYKQPAGVDRGDQCDSCC